MIRNTTLQRSLLALAALNLAVIVWDIVTGGIYFTAFGVAFSSREIAKPLRYAAGCAATAVWLRDRAVRPSWDAWPSWTPRAAAALALASSGIAIWFGVRAAGGSDAYGYVSEAAQWLRRSLVADDPLAAVTPQLGAAVAPLGYRLAPGGGLVSVYPPGLPLTMAFAQWLGGPEAVFFVVPAFAGIAIWFTYVAGARAVSDRVGLLAAIALSCSPLFFLQSFEPMSDVPAAAWWTAAWAMAMSAAPWSAFGAGVAVAAAILTRPNLAPLAAIVAASVALSAPRLRRVAAFGAPVVAGCLLVAAFNAALYGSPVMSGYGLLGALFSRANVIPNLRAYARWLNDLYSPAILLALAAPWLCRRAAAMWAMLAFSAGVALSYVFYVPFGDWPFARFLLPAIPPLLVMTGAVAIAAIERLPPALRSSAAIVCAALIAARGIDVASRLHVFDIAGAEQRYATIGDYVGRTLPSNAVVVTSIHSGSVRRYGHRLTLRWDALPPDGLDRAIALLRDRGYAPYLLLEDWEEPLYRDHFGRANTFGALDWPPAIEYPWSGRARVWAIDDRARHLAGTRVVTAPIPTSD